MKRVRNALASTLLTGLVAGSAAAGGLLIAPPPAQALQSCVPDPSPIPAYDPSASCLVTVNNQSWEIRTVTGAFGGNGIIDGIDLTTTPWWQIEQDQDIVAFIISLGFGLGQQPNSEGFGPLFAFSNAEPNPPNTVVVGVYIGSKNLDAGPLPINTPFVYAYAVPVSVPGPLPVLGAAVAFSASRRIRRRLRGAPS